MSLDGSFSAAAALARLLARCPALRSDPRILSLASAAPGPAAAPARDDVAAALAEPLLHPCYTILVLGCFLPFAPALVAAGPDALRADVGDAAADDKETGEGDVRVVEFVYPAARARVPRIRARSRPRPLLAYICIELLQVFSTTIPKASMRRFSIASSFQEELQLSCDATQVSYWFLELEPRVFCDQWDYSCLLDLVYSTADYSLADNSLHSVVLDLRWCAIQILMVVLKASDMAIESFGFRADEAFACLLRWKEFCTDTSLEKASLYFQNQVGNSKRSVDGLASLADCFSDWAKAAMGENIALELMHVTKKWPVLLYGPVGAGKISLINKLAQISGNRVLSIHMDEQMEGRTLIGSYVCTEKPGEFKWAPGSLTQAIAKGFWIVFEAIDKAPSDVQAILLPLVEGSSSFSIGHAEAVEVADSFRLFATITTSKNDVSHALEGMSIQKEPFADIRRALEVLERVAYSVKYNEPILGGETGTWDYNCAESCCMA
ncbi:hypothetical protein ACP4OV_028536 [Aristida adscensionis]